jgi:DNA-binding LacI/PurR family transcriptional regulator
MNKRKPRPTLASIAAELGVSPASVSNALKRPERVSADLRERVLSVATRVGYSGPAAATRLLPNGRSNSIAILFTTDMPNALQDPAAVAVLQGLSTVCEAAGLSMLLVPDMTAQPGARLATVADAIVDGFVVYSLRDADPLLVSVLRREAAVVVIDAPRRVEGADWVGVDDRAAMSELGEYLRDLGHTAVGVISPQLNESRHNGTAEPARWQRSSYALMRERIEGLARGLGVAAELLPIEERFAPTAASGADALDALLDRRPELTAVCCLTDTLALGALTAARQRGLAIPAELTITGFDDIPEAIFAGLTTVAQPHAEKGRMAGDLLATAAAHSVDRRRLLRTHLQIRSTSGVRRQ